MPPASTKTASNKRKLPLVKAPENAAVLGVEAIVLPFLQEETTEPNKTILLRGAKLHNLKNVTCRFPHGKLSVITGPSGSGKSSLAFDTLYAEGQRRFLESLNTYARQFFQRLDKPNVESIENLLPSIALEQKNPVQHARSTVGTSSECYEALRHVLAYLGQPECSECGASEVRQVHAETIARSLLQAWGEGARLHVVALLPKSAFSLEGLLSMGYFRLALPNADVFTLEAKHTEADLHDTLTSGKVWPVLMDRLVLKTEKSTQEGQAPKLPERLLEALRQAAQLSGGQVLIQRLNASKTDEKQPLTELNKAFTLGFACMACGAPQTPPTPAMFSFNHPLHACPTCEGYGRIIGVDPDKVVPNRDMSLKEGAIHPFEMPSNIDLKERLLIQGRKAKIRLDVPYKELTEAERHWVWQGDGFYEGVRPFFDYLESKRYKVHIRVMLARYRGYSVCPACKGTRLRPAALRIKLQGKGLQEMLQMPLGTLYHWLLALAFPSAQQEAAQRIMADLLRRLSTLNKVGVGYLSLGRNMRTLSGGEAQRVQLARALGCDMTDTLYVLDEPTVGLHPRDTQRLMSVLKELTAQGNTLVVVEHDPDVMAQAEHNLELGPGSGQHGGYVVYEGTWQGLLATDYSITAQALREQEKQVQAANANQHPITPADEKPLSPPLRLCGAAGNNLKALDVTLPTGQWITVTGVSGSGKSTLVKQTLYANYLLGKGELPASEVSPCKAIEGLNQFASVELVDQSPLGRSSRSNPVTYVKAYDEIRQLFAGAPKAMALGLSAGDFSFNTTGGRCERCEGLGTVTIDMQFMADVTLTCPDCDGQRFGPAVLSVELYERNLNDVLNMSVDEALAFFKTAPKIKKRLEPLAQLGLGYLRLGQATDTLSGGEAQRLKLASFLMKPKRKEHERPSLFLFDEPTTGLHMADVAMLINVLRQLVSHGHTLIVVEHNTQLIAQSDWVLELGPEGGDEGGYIVVEGSPATVAACMTSPTGEALRDYGLQAKTK
jgi:excinuclease ABC subunit A